MLAIAQSPSLSGFKGFFEEYVLVFLEGKNVYRTQIFKRGDCPKTRMSLH